MTRAAIIITDAPVVYWDGGISRDRGEAPTDPQLLADLRYLVNAVRGPESARVRAAIGDNDG